MTAPSRPIETFLQEARGCRLVAFGDLGADLVLLSGGPKGGRREYLDTLSAEAVRLYRAHDRFAGPNEGHCDGPNLMVLAPGEVRLYQRAADDFLCLVCEDPDSARALETRGEALLTDLGQGAHG